MSEKASVQERELTPGKPAAAYYDSGFLKGAHLTPGRDYPVRIVRITAIRAKYRNEPEAKSQLRLYLHEGDLRRHDLEPLPLHLNPTNRETIERIHGEEPIGWKGKAITLYRDKTDVGREKNVPCIRVRPQAPQSKRERIAAHSAELDRQHEEAIVPHGTAPAEPQPDAPEQSEAERGWAE